MILSSWQYTTDDGRLVGIAKKGRNDAPWRIGYFSRAGTWCSCYESIRKQFRSREQAQEYLDRYADKHSWRLYDPKYEELLKGSLKTPHLKTLIKKSNQSKQQPERERS